MQAAFQTPEDVYAGLHDTQALKANREFWKITGTVEFAALSTEDQEILHAAQDYEERQVQARPAFVSLKWQKGELARAHAEVMSGWIDASNMAMHRWIAAVKRNALTGAATAQYEGETTSSEKNLSGDQIIAEGGTSMTAAKVRQIRSQFVKNKALKSGEKIYCAVSQDEIDVLITEDKFINNDFGNNTGAVESGTVIGAGRLYGVTFIHDEDLNVSGTTRTCPAWVKSGLKYGTQSEVFTRMSELENRHYMDQFYSRVDVGATRTRELAVMSVLTDSDL